MSEARCCAEMDTRWTHQVVEGSLADVFYCGACGHVHRAERYALALRFPKAGRCVNCGGDRRELPGFSADRPDAGDFVRCTQCGKSATEDREMHDRLAALHPSRDFLRASRALAKSQRNVLAVKLATAEVSWGADPVSGMIARLELLDAIDETERAVDEAYEWADLPGAPVDVWGIVAQLEASAGNVDGAIKALERGLSIDSDRAGWWTEYAELLSHTDDRPSALRAASRGLISPATESRCIAVIVEISERYWAAGMFAEALAACSIAGSLQERYAELAFLRARMAVNQQDSGYVLRWLKATIDANPSHPEANAMLAQYDRPEKKGWFTW